MCGRPDMGRRVGVSPQGRRGLSSRHWTIASVLDARRWSPAPALALLTVIVLWDLVVAGLLLSHAFSS
jgi:hypothetical protein